jgi:hypothetical protein
MRTITKISNKLHSIDDIGPVRLNLSAWSHGTVFFSHDKSPLHNKEHLSPIALYCAKEKSALNEEK